MGMRNCTQVIKILEILYFVLGFKSSKFQVPVSPEYVVEFLNELNNYSTFLKITFRYSADTNLKKTEKIVLLGKKSLTIQNFTN